MTKEKYVTCPSCGGTFPELLPKCPYCETLNPKGAQKAYMDQLEQMRGNLGEMADDVEEGYARQLKKSGSRVGRIFLIVLIVIGAMVALIMGMSFYGRAADNRETKAELAFRKAHFAELDAAYAQGDDDAVLELINTLYEEEGSGALWSWKHYDYYYMYRHYQTVQMAEETFRNAPRPFEKTVRDLLTDAAYYAIQADQAPDQGLTDMKFSQEEKQKVLAWAEEETRFLRETLGLTDKVIEDLYQGSLNKEFDYLEFQKFEKNFGKILNTLE